MYKALKSFAGKINMRKGEAKDLQDQNIIKDLLNAGYIEEVKEESKKLKNEIKKDVEKVVEKVETEVKKVTSRKPRTKK